MKTLLMIFLTTFISLSSGNLVWSQPNERQGPPPIPNASQIEKMVGELTNELALSKKQSIKISKMYKDHFKEVKMRVEKDRKEHEAEKEKMDALRRNFEKEIKAELTEEQQNLFVEFQKNHRPPKRGQEKR